MLDAKVGRLERGTLAAGLDAQADERAERAFVLSAAREQQDTAAMLPCETEQAALPGGRGTRGCSRGEVEHDHAEGAGTKQELGGAAACMAACGPRSPAMACI